MLPDATPFSNMEEEVDGGISPLRRLYSDTASVEEEIELEEPSDPPFPARSVMVRISSAFTFRSLIPASRISLDSGTGMVIYIGIISPSL